MRGAKVAGVAVVRYCCRRRCLVELSSGYQRIVRHSDILGQNLGPTFMGAIPTGVDDLMSGEDDVTAKEECKMPMAYTHSSPCSPSS